jgi:hypothetical protein
LYSLRTDGDFCHQVLGPKISNGQNLLKWPFIGKLSRSTFWSCHWKIFSSNMHFLNFCQNTHLIFSQFLQNLELHLVGLYPPEFPSVGPDTFHENFITLKLSILYWKRSVSSGESSATWVWHQASVWFFNVEFILSMKPEYRLIVNNYWIKCWAAS